MGDARRQEEPLASIQGHPFAIDVDHGGPGEHDDPLVLVLDVDLRLGAPAQDLLDDEVAEAKDRLEPLTLGRCVGAREQGASAPGARNRA